MKAQAPRENKIDFDYAKTLIKCCKECLNIYGKNEEEKLQEEKEENKGKGQKGGGEEAKKEVKDKKKNVNKNKGIGRAHV